MAAIRYFTVTQEREIKISTTDPATAVVIATEAFDNNSSTGISDERGRVTSGIIDKAISAREDY